MTPVETIGTKAELVAITASMELLHQKCELTKRKQCDVVTFSYSSSALDALKTPPFQHQEVEKTTRAIHNLLTSYNIKVTLQWIPGHNDI